MSRAAEAFVVDDVATAFADLLGEVVAAASVARASASIALSGGATARRCYAALARRLPPTWGDTTVYFSDERWVAVTDPDSNEGAARAALLAGAPPGRVCSLRGTEATPMAAAAAYDAILRAAPPIDLVHLGLGTDGHTASLFPGSAALDEATALVVATGDDHHPHPRLTFTYPAIARAGTVVVTVAGAEKRDALARVRAGDLTCPATRITAARVVWLVGRDAA